MELAPGKVWADPSAATRRECRDRWAALGVEVVAMQTLLFGHPELVLLGSPGERRALLDYLGRICRVGGWLGARALVFGSPGDRPRGAMEPREAEEVSVAFFRQARRVAEEQGVPLALEANPEAYGCDFVTRVAEARARVREVASPGFALHLHSGGMPLAGEPPAVRPRSGSRDYHVSEPYLTEPGTGGVPHPELARALHDGGYTGWVYIEMKAQSEHDNLPALERSLRAAVQAYGGAGG